MRIVVAPDKFAGSLTAPQVVAQLQQGWLSVRPDDEVVSIPLSDGGPGFIDCLAATAAGEVHTLAVTGPMGTTVSAKVLAGPTWYIEAAQANGLHHVAVADRDPWHATTFGVGQLIGAVVAAGARRVVVGLGGAATDDGGAGALGALGATATDAASAPVDLSAGPAALAGVMNVDLRPARAVLKGVELVIATDVDNPLLGPEGATMMFAPQKGAAAADLVALEEIMGQWADACGTVSGDRGLAGAPGAGAAGGLGFALMLLGGRRVAGIDVIMAATDFVTRCRSADLVITGEGRLDEQSLHGKVVSGVVAAAGGVPVAVVAGQSLLPPAQWRAAGIARVETLVQRAASTQEAIARAAPLTKQVGADLAAAVEVRS